eukprot:5121764-Amphidinium_carterae.1
MPGFLRCSKPLFAVTLLDHWPGRIAWGLLAVRVGILVRRPCLGGSSERCKVGFATCARVTHTATPKPPGPQMMTCLPTILLELSNEEVGDYREPPPFRTSSFDDSVLRAKYDRVLKRQVWQRQRGRKAFQSLLLSLCGLLLIRKLLS